MRGKYSSLVFWAWNDKITYDGIDEQLQQFANADIGGVVIHARAGLKIEYMSDEWMKLIVYSVKKAKQLGLKIVIYDENGWPSGFAGGMVVKSTPDFAMRQIVFSKNKPATDEIICSYKKGGDNYILGGDDLFACVKRNNDYVDLTNKQVTEKFIELTHEKYKKACGEEFGKTIVAVFTDEPQYSTFENFSYPYSLEIDNDFFDFCGINLKENLWRLYAEGSGEFKKLYLKFFSKRFLNNYTKVVAKWCEENHLDMTGHFSAEDGIISQACGNGGVMQHYKLMQRPGIDYLGRRFTSPVLLKQLESIKNQYGKDIVISESFGGAGWGCGLKDYTRIWCYEAAFGVNQLCVHLSPYSITGVRKRDYPGFFSDVQPWWRHAKDFFNKIENLNELLSSGMAINRVAVVHPISVALGMGNFSKEQRELSTQFRLLTENLLDCQIDFDYVDEESLNSALIKSNRLVVEKQSYEVVVAIDETLSKEIINKLRDVKLGIVGQDVFNRRDDINRWFMCIGYKRNVSVTDRDGIARGIIVSYKERENDAIAFVYNRDGDSSKYLQINGDFSSITEISFNGDQKRISATAGLSNNFAKVEIPEGEAKTFILSKDEVQEKYVETVKELEVKEVSLADKNCFTIDRASYSLDGINYSENKDIIKVSFEVYSHNGGTVFVKYTFNSKIKGKNIALFTENGYKNIIVNGIEPKKSSSKFFSSKLQSYDISELVIIGVNSIIMRYEIPKDISVKDKWEFESLRNIYFLPVEVESVYLVGDFSIDSDIKWVTSDYLIASNNFAITDRRNVNCLDITESGAPFYRGKADIESEFYYDVGKAYFCVEFFGSMAELFINGKSAGCVYDGDKLNITAFVKQGKNTVKLELYSTNRNLLGAHHHVCGEVRMTGRNTFEGNRGFEDFVNPSAPQVTYTDSYSFIPFGIKRMAFITRNRV